MVGFLIQLSPNVHSSRVRNPPLDTGGRSSMWRGVALVFPLSTSASPRVLHSLGCTKKKGAGLCCASTPRVQVRVFEMHVFTCTTRSVHTLKPRRTTRVLINQKQFHSTSPAVVVELGRYLNTPSFNAEAKTKYTTQDPIDFSIEERRCLQNPE